MTWQNAFKEGENIVMATASKKGKPHAIYVESLGFVDGKLLIGACQMKITLLNLQNNNQVSVVTHDDSGYYRIDGICSIYSSGKYLDMAIEKSKPSYAKFAILIEIEEVFDLDKAEKIA